MISVEELIEMMTVVEAGDCAYLPNLKESLLALRCPGLPNSLHAELIERGFRHSGDVFYRTQCQNCHQCMPMRIDPLAFHPGKKQRHIFNKNRDIEIHLTQPVVTPEKLEIYKKYLKFQHPDSKQEPTLDSLRSIFVDLPSSVEIQYIINQNIAGITIADIIPEKAFSSVYHFFDPQFAHRSIGVFSMIAEIQICKYMNIPFYYPGLWIKDCKKMNYKSQYKPHQLLIDDTWVDHVIDD